VRHIGVDLHKTNFVACFLAADDTQRLETYPLTRDGLARFKRQLRQADELAVEATQNVYFFFRDGLVLPPRASGRPRQPPSLHPALAGFN